MGAHDWLGELVTNGVVAPDRARRHGRRLPRTSPSTPSTYEGKVYSCPTRSRTSRCCATPTSPPKPPATFDDMIAKGTAAGTRRTRSSSSRAPRATRTTCTRSRPSFGAPVFGTNADGGYDPTTCSSATPAARPSPPGSAARARTAPASSTPTSPATSPRRPSRRARPPFWLTGPWNVGAADGRRHQRRRRHRSRAPAAEPAQPFAGVQGLLRQRQSRRTRLPPTTSWSTTSAPKTVQLALFEVGQRPARADRRRRGRVGRPDHRRLRRRRRRGRADARHPAMGSVWQFWGIAEAAIINGADPVATVAEAGRRRRRPRSS